LWLFFLRAQALGNTLTPCILSVTFDSKTDSKTGRQQWIFMDNSGHSIGFWSGWKTLCDFTQFFAASALIKLPQRFSNEHKVGNDKEEILRTLPS